MIFEKLGWRRELDGGVLLIGNLLGGML